MNELLTEEKVIGFLKRLKEVFPRVEVIFDAMTGKARRLWMKAADAGF